MREIYVIIALYGFGSAMSMGASQTFAADLAPPDRRGAFLGVWTTIGNFGSIIAPLIIGAVATNFGYAPGLCTGRRLHDAERGLHARVRP